MDTKEIIALIQQRKNAIMLYRRVVGYLIAVITLASTTLLYRHISQDRPYFEGKPVSREAWLDEASLKYMKLSQRVENSSYCMPLHVDVIRDVEIYFHHCPEKVFAERGQRYEIFPDYVVDQRIARRFHFWREVYSTWSSDQFVIHASYYPEVILEAIDVSHMQENLDTNQRKKIADSVIKDRKQIYRAILVKMHRMHRKGQPFTSPSMLRIESLVQHISDKNKYWNMARALRTQRGQRDYIASGLQASGRYLPAIRKKFEEQGVPVELSNIAFIESSFNLNAYSKVGAGGIFQIMPETGKQYMIINDIIDERKDPIKSAEAAAKLLKLNHRLTDEWPLAITAYNHGVGGINRAIKAVKSKDIVDLIEKYEGRGFGFASKNFYTGFLGLLDSLKNADRIFPSVMRFSELKYAEYRLPTQKRINDIKKELNISNDIISFYNPDLSRSAILNNAMLPARYRLKYPRTEPQPTELTSEDKKDNS